METNCSAHPGVQVLPRTMASGHADAEARRSVLTALPCATLVTSMARAIETNCSAHPGVQVLP